MAATDTTVGCDIGDCGGIKAVNDCVATVPFSGSGSAVSGRVPVGGCASIAC